jgi:hypothetical protein
MIGRMQAALAWVLLGAMFAWTTDTGTIAGVVSDPGRAAIPEVAVKAVSTSTVVARAATTNTQGSYVLPNLPVGIYAVSFHKEGFRGVRKTAVVIDVNTALRADAALQVSGVRQEVTVSINPVQVKTTRTDLPQTRRGILERLCQ